MTKFTPGPWDHDSGMYGNGKAYHSIFSPDEIIIAEFNPLSVTNPEQGRANAALIAAAPDMYEALEEAREWFYDHSDINDNGGPNKAMRITEQIDAALAKAGRR